MDPEVGFRGLEFRGSGWKAWVQMGSRVLGGFRGSRGMAWLWICRWRCGGRGAFEPEASLEGWESEFPP